VRYGRCSTLKYPGYDDLLDSVYRTRDWWRTVYILERVLLYAAGLFAVVLALTFVEAHVHFSRAVRWPLFVLLMGYFAGASPGSSSGRSSTSGRRRRWQSTSSGGSPN